MREGGGEIEDVVILLAQTTIYNIYIYLKTIYLHKIYLHILHTGCCLHASRLCLALPQPVLVHWQQQEQQRGVHWHAGTKRHWMKWISYGVCLWVGVGVGVTVGMDGCGVTIVLLFVQALIYSLIGAHMHPLPHTDTAYSTPPCILLLLLFHTPKHPMHPPCPHNHNRYQAANECIEVGMLTLENLGALLLRFRPPPPPGNQPYSEGDLLPKGVGCVYAFVYVRDGSGGVEPCVCLHVCILLCICFCGCAEYIIESHPPQHHHTHHYQHTKTWLMQCWK